MQAPDAARTPDVIKNDPETEITRLDEDISKLKNEIDKLNVSLKAIQESSEANLKKKNDRMNWRPRNQAQMDATEKLLNETQIKLQAIPPDDNSLANQATKVVLLTEQKLGETQKTKLLAEQTHYEKSEQEKVLRNEKSLLDAQAKAIESQRAELEKRQTELVNQRSELVKKQAKDNERKQADKYPLLKYSLGINTELADEAGKVNKQIEHIKTKLTKNEEELKKVQDDFQDTVTRVITIGPTESIGALLRYRKFELPDINQHLSDAEQSKSEMDEDLYKMFEIDQRRDELSPETIREEILNYIKSPEYAKSQESKPVKSQAELEKEIDELIEKPQGGSAEADAKSPVDRLIEDRMISLERVFDRREELSRELAEVIQLENRLIKETKQFREYIDERILWIRSNDLLFSNLSIDETDKAALKLSSWKGALSRAGQVISQKPVVAVLAVLVVVLLLIMKPRMRRETDKFSQLASRSSCDTFWPTAKALILTIVIGITVPLIAVFLGLLLSEKVKPETPGDTLFNALGPSLLIVAGFAMPFEILRRFCRPNGLANEHFDWSDRAVEKLRHQLGQMILPGSIAVFLIALFRNLDQIERKNGIDLIERTLFVVAMIGFAYLIWQTFSPKTGIFADYLKTHERSWANQIAVLWFGLIVGIPVLLAILTILGYYFTAIQLFDRAFWSFVFALVVETIRESLKRMILVRRRHVHIQAARRKHELQVQARREQLKSQSEGSAPLIVESVPELNDMQLDIDENAKQASKLVSLSMALMWAIGLWMIWTDVMPALQALDRIPVWNRDGELLAAVSGNEKSPETSNGSTTTPVSAMPNPTSSTETIVSSNDPLTEVTYHDSLVFIVIVILTVISARNLPSALEMVLLEQLPFDRSLRYAIKSVTSYAIVMIGIFLAFQALSIGWNNVQWLVTALTFGLAFGLQEIFANFVAGIILMFERPMRIGDLITVDDFTGTVTKIQTRATTIVNWDRKEYVIPNRDFITGRLVNWTLSDAINRIVVTVGVAYGSDVEKAKSILLDLCKQNPKIVDDPPPTVVFELFADSTLNITIRAFLDQIENRLLVIDDLHCRINAAFNEAGIVIAFPQRDLHISSVDPQVTAVIRDSRSLPTGKNLDKIKADSNRDTD